MTVSLSDNANGIVIADAIRLVDVSEALVPTLADAGSITAAAGNESPWSTGYAQWAAAVGRLSLNGSGTTRGRGSIGLRGDHIAACGLGDAGAGLERAATYDGR